MYLYIDSIIYILLDNGVLTDNSVIKLRDSLSHTCPILKVLWLTCIINIL